MSYGLRKRTRCTVCRERLRITPVQVRLLTQKNQYPTWLHLRAVLCPPCLEAWLEPFLYEVDGDLELGDHDQVAGPSRGDWKQRLLYPAAPITLDELARHHCWPRSRVLQAHDRWYSALWR